MSESNGVIAIDILMELEKVFSKEIEYDECLMNLGLHTAQVRKTCPNLFIALSTVGRDQTTSKPAEADSVLASSLKELLETIKQQQASAVAVQVQPTPPADNRIQFTPVPKNIQEAARFEASTPPGFTPAPVVEEEKPLPTYTEFAQRFAVGSKLGDEWLINWDNPAPLPTLNGPLTLRTEAGRLRFNVIAIDEDLRRIRLRHIAAPTGG